MWNKENVQFTSFKRFHLHETSIHKTDYQTGICYQKLNYMVLEVSLVNPDTSHLYFKTMPLKEKIPPKYLSHQNLNPFTLSLQIYWVVWCLVIFSHYFFMWSYCLPNMCVFGLSLLGFQYLLLGLLISSLFKVSYSYFLF